MLNIYLTIVLAPLIGSVLVGLAGNRLGRKLSHSITILGVAVSTVLSLYVFNHHVLNNGDVFNHQDFERFQEINIFVDEIINLFYLFILK